MEILLDRLSVRHGDGMPVLRALTLAIPSGQFCAVLGASGAGKSTLLRALAGAVPLSSGQLHLDGTPVAAVRLSARRRRIGIGIVPQDLALCGRASVADTVMSTARIAGWRSLFRLYPEAERRRASRLLARLGLEPALIGRRVDSLSGGQQQRVAIARALQHRPTLILADEPVASLDPATAATTLALIRAEARSLDATVICSLHQPELARRFADRIITLDAGRISVDSALAEHSAARIRPAEMPA